MLVYNTYKGTIANVNNLVELKDYIAQEEDWLASYLWMAPGVKVEQAIVVVTEEMAKRLI